MNYLFLTIFWIGVIILNWPQNYGLKERAMKYLGMVKAGAGKTHISILFERVSASIRRDALEKELAQALAYVKNIVILGRGKGISAQLLLEELAEISDKLKPVFTEMSKHLSVCNVQSASDCLYQAFGTGFARDLGNFLSEWEKVPQEELLQTVEIYNQSLRKQRQGRRERRDETISDLIYFPVVINCLAVMMNFIYVAFFIEQQELLQMLF